MGWDRECVTDSELLERAKELRRRPTEWEVRLWRHFSRSQLGDHKFRRQQVNRPYICDFLCPAKALVVEIDGHTHDPVEDARRDAYLLRRGFRTLRFTNMDVREDMDGVLQTITAELARSPDRWPDPVLTAPPQPLP